MGSPINLPSRPVLKALVRDASSALAWLDSARLAELAEACEALNRELPVCGERESAAFVEEAREALRDMSIFERVLDATRANMRVIDRLAELREGRVEYSERQAKGWRGEEGGSGDH